MKTKFFLLILLTTSVALLLISLPNRAIFIDDHWFAEQAYWLANQGVVRSELFGSLLDYEIQQFAYHKLHVWQAAVIIDTFGLSAYALKSVNLVFFSLFLIFLFKYFKNNYEKEFASKYFLVSIVVLTTHAFLVEQIFNYRPEIAIMLFGFLSFLFLRAALKDSGKISYIVFSAVMAGIAVLYHLNGVVFIFAALGLLVLDKKFKTVLLYSFVAGLISCIYFIDIIKSGSMAQFVYQFGNDPAIHSGDVSVWQRLFNILLEFKHLFHKLTEGTYFLLFICLMVVNWRAINENPETKMVLRYFLILFFVLTIFFPGRREPNHYLILHLPYVAILMGYCFYKTLYQSRQIKITVFTLASLFMLSNYVYTLKLIDQQKPTPYTNAKMMETLNIKSSQTVVAGPVSLVFNELEHRKLYAVRTFFIKADKGFAELSVDAFFADMANNNVDHIILPEIYATVLELTEPEKIVDLHGYHYESEYIDVDRNYYTFKKKLFSVTE